MVSQSFHSFFGIMLLELFIFVYFARSTSWFLRLARFSYSFKKCQRKLEPSIDPELSIALSPHLPWKHEEEGLSLNRSVCWGSGFRLIQTLGLASGLPSTSHVSLVNCLMCSMPQFLYKMEGRYKWVAMNSKWICVWRGFNTLLA